MTARRQCVCLCLFRYFVFVVVCYYKRVVYEISWWSSERKRERESAREGRKKTFRMFVHGEDRGGGLAWMDGWVGQEERGMNDNNTRKRSSYTVVTPWIHTYSKRGYY